MKKLFLLTLLVCICSIHLFAEGWIDTDGFSFKAHDGTGDYSGRYGANYVTLSNGVRVPKEAIIDISEKLKNNEHHLTIPSTVKYEYTYREYGGPIMTGTEVIKVTAIMSFSSYNASCENLETITFLGENMRMIAGSTF